MTLTELADRVGMTLANLDPQDRQGARDPLLDAGCDLRALSCRAGDILRFEPEHAERARKELLGFAATDTIPVRRTWEGA